MHQGSKVLGGINSENKRYNAYFEIRMLTPLLVPKRYLILSEEMNTQSWQKLFEKTTNKRTMIQNHADYFHWTKSVLNNVLREYETCTVFYGQLKNVSRHQLPICMRSY